MFFRKYSHGWDAGHPDYTKPGFIGEGGGGVPMEGPLDLDISMADVMDDIKNSEKYLCKKYPYTGFSETATSGFGEVPAENLYFYRLMEDWRGHKKGDLVVTEEIEDTNPFWVAIPATADVCFEDMIKGWIDANVNEPCVVHLSLYSKDQYMSITVDRCKSAEDAQRLSDEIQKEHVDAFGEGDYTWLFNCEEGE